MSSSPIDRELLDPVLAPALERARTLPAEAYTSQAVFDWESTHLFEQGWICLGRADHLSDPGDQRAYRIGIEGVLVVRDHEGTLRGFSNTCRHRGHELLEPGTSRNLRAIKCPYHAWVYQLDGALGGAPRFGDLEGFDRTEHPLVSARIEEWHGWIFVNADGSAPSFVDHVGNLDELIAPWEVGRLVVAETHEYEIAANWKTITENYHECYHCPSIHPALCDVTPVDSGQNFAHDGLWVGGNMELKDFALFPDLLISLHPDYVMTHRVDPCGPGRTKIECQWLFPPEAYERANFDPGYATEFWDITNREDWLACESVYRGLQSRGFRQGPFATSEDEVHTFMAMVAKAYVDGFASKPPQVHQPFPAVA